jgi:Gram-negative bacterial TonB protein C-terminal
MKKPQLQCIALIAASTLISSAFAAETIFPKKSRTLTVKPPAECREWVAPLPLKQTAVEFPDDGKGLKGNVALLVRIGPDGGYQGLIDYLADDDAFVRAAEKSVKDWTFTPAQCNGAAVASDARVEFEFRREGGITYKTGATSFNR